MSKSIVEFLEKTYADLFKTIDGWKQKTDLLRQNLLEPLQTILVKVNNPLLVMSVVTPAYNFSRILHELYESLKKQTIARDIEWIIVDDCSTDNSLEFYNYLSEDKTLGSIRIYRNKANLGAAMTVKRGFELASCEYIAKPDGDDFYMSNDKLEKDLYLLHNGYDYVFSRNVVTGETPQTGTLHTVPNRVYKDNYHFLSEIIFWNFFSNSSLAIKRSTYFEIGGVNEFMLNSSADLDYQMRLILMNKKIGISETTIFYRLTSNQSSKNFSIMAVGHAFVTLSYLTLLHKLGLFEKIREYLISEWFDLVYKTEINGQINLLGLMRHSPWFSSLMGAPYLTEVFLRSAWPQFEEKHNKYIAKVIEMSSTFRNTETFKTFSESFKRYINKSS